jgi:hypothetical protein
VRATAVLVVHDGACGTCARTAADLAALLRVPVRARSCRDPDLHRDHPGLPAAARDCRTPAVGTLAPGRPVRWRTGLRAAPALLPLVRPRALPRAAAVLVGVLRAGSRRG